MLLPKKTLLFLPVLALLGVCVPAVADTMVEVKYLGADNYGFTLLYDLDAFHNTTLGIGQNSFGDFQSILVNGNPIPASEIGLNPGQFAAGVFFVPGNGGTLLRYAFVDAGTDNILNNFDGNIFPTIRGLAEGETVTAVRQGNTLTATNVSPEPAAFGLTSIAGLGLLIRGIKRRRDS